MLFSSGRDVLEKKSLKEWKHVYWKPKNIYEENWKVTVLVFLVFCVTLLTQEMRQQKIDGSFHFFSFTRKNNLDMVLEEL